MRTVGDAPVPRANSDHCGSQKYSHQEGHHGTQRSRAAELTHGNEIAGTQRPHADGSGERGQETRPEGLAKRGPDAIRMRLFQAIVVVQDMNRDFESKDHHHDRQCVEHKVHFAATGPQDCNGCPNRENGEAHDHAGQRPATQLVVNQARTDRERDEEKQLVVFFPTQAVQFGDHHRRAGHVDRLTIQLAVLQDFANVCHGSGPVANPLFRQHDDSPDPLAVARDKDSVEPLGNICVFHAEFTHHRVHASRSPTATHTGLTFDSPRDALDQLVAETGVEADQNDFLGTESSLELFVGFSNLRVFRQPSFDVVVRADSVRIEIQDWEKRQCQQQ